AFREIDDELSILNRELDFGLNVATRRAKVCVNTDTAADAFRLEPRAASNSEQRDGSAVGVLCFDAEQQLEIDVSTWRNWIERERRMQCDTDPGRVVRLYMHGAFPQIGEVHRVIERGVAGQTQLEFKAGRRDRCVHRSAQNESFQHWRLSRLLINRRV